MLCLYGTLFYMLLLYIVILQLNDMKDPVEWIRHQGIRQDEPSVSALSIQVVYPDYANSRVIIFALVWLIISLSLFTSLGLTSAISAMRYAMAPFESEYCFSTL